MEAAGAPGCETLSLRGACSFLKLGVTPSDARNMKILARSVLPAACLLLLAVPSHACDIVPIQSIDPKTILSDPKYLGAYLGVVEEVTSEGPDEISRIRVTEHFKGLKSLSDVRARSWPGAAACGVTRSVGDEVMVVIFRGAHETPRAYSVRRNDPFVLRLRAARREAEEKFFREWADLALFAFSHLIPMHTAGMEVCGREFPEQAKQYKTSFDETRSKNPELFLRVESREDFLNLVQQEQALLLKSAPAERAEFCNKFSEHMADLAKLAAQGSELLRLMAKKAASEKQ